MGIIYRFYGNRCGGTNGGGGEAERGKVEAGTKSGIMRKVGAFRE